MQLESATMQTLNTDELRLEAYEVSPERGFLPAEDPLPYLEDPYYAPWEQIAGDLPKLLVARKLRQVVESMPRLSTERLQTERERRRAMLLLSYIGHGYVWNGDAPAERIPANLAVPWYELSEQLGRPPVLSYASYALDNWRRLDPNAPIELGNIVLLQNFLAGLDEEWFILIHVDIEAKAARAIRQIPDRDTRRRDGRPADADRRPARSRRRAGGNVRCAGAHARSVRPVHLLPSRAPLHPRLEE
jgi:indoleamine 2,3-dioxygenase